MWTCWSSGNWYHYHCCCRLCDLGIWWVTIAKNHPLTPTTNRELPQPKCNRNHSLQKNQKDNVSILKCKSAQPCDNINPSLVCIFFMQKTPTTHHPPPTPNQQRTQYHNVMTTRLSFCGNKLLFEGGAYDHIVIPNGQCDVTAVNIATAMMSPADR